MSKQLKTKEDEKKEAEILELRERMLARVRAAISELESSTGDKTIDICQRLFADFAELHPDSVESGELKQIADFFKDHLEKTQPN